MEPPRPLPPGSVIICTRNRPALLTGAVESILHGEDVPAEIIIVDQSSVPHPVYASSPMLEGRQIRYIATQSVGLGQARNEGIVAAQHDILAFTDDDILVAPGWYGALVRPLIAEGPRSAVTGRVLVAEESKPGGFAPSIKPSERHAVFEGRFTYHQLAGGNSALFRSAFKEVGLFDVRFGVGAPFRSADDMDLGFRLLAAGYRIIYNPEALVYHRAWRSTRHFLPTRWGYGVGRGAVYAKHGPRHWYLFRIMAVDVKSQLWWCFGRMRREPLPALGNLALASGTVAGTVWWWLTQGIKDAVEHRKRSGI